MITSHGAGLWSTEVRQALIFWRTQWHECSCGTRRKIAGGESTPFTNDSENSGSMPRIRPKVSMCPRCGALKEVDISVDDAYRA